MLTDILFQGRSTSLTTVTRASMTSFLKGLRRIAE